MGWVLVNIAKAERKLILSESWGNKVSLIHRRGEEATTLKGWIVDRRVELELTSPTLRSVFSAPPARLVHSMLTIYPTEKKQPQVSFLLCFDTS